MTIGDKNMATKAKPPQKIKSAMIIPNFIFCVNTLILAAYDRITIFIGAINILKNFPIKVDT